MCGCTASFSSGEIKIRKQYLSSYTQDRLRAKIIVSNSVIRLINRISRNSTVRAAFNIWNNSFQRARYSCIWLFQTKAIIIKARRSRLEEIQMAEELKNIIRLETLAALSKSKDQEEVDILTDDPQLFLKRLPNTFPPKISKKQRFFDTL